MLQRYFIHLHNKVYTPKDAAVILRTARKLVAEEHEQVILRDSRVSKKFLEFDTSIPEEMEVGDLIAKLEKIAPLASFERISERHIEKNDAIKRAIELFNDEKYWGTHESLEAVWKATPAGPEKDLLNGLILIAAAFVHDQKDEQEICFSILRRSLNKLEDATGTYHGIDLDKVISKVEQILASGIVDRFTI